MEHRPSLPVFALTYLPAAMLAGGSSLLVLLGFAIAPRGLPSWCGEPLLAATLISLTLLILGAPMIILGMRACGSVIIGTAPVGFVFCASWMLAAVSAGGCGGLWQAGRFPAELLLMVPAGFITLSVAVFLAGLWRLTCGAQPHPTSRAGQVQA